MVAIEAPAPAVVAPTAAPPATTPETAPVASPSVGARPRRSAGDPLDAVLARTVRRRANGGPVLQRLLSSGSTITALDVGDNELAALGAAVDAYNAGRHDPQSAGDYNACFTALRAVERRIYRWTDANATGPKLLNEQPHVPALRTLLGEAEAEHEQLIGETKAMPGVLPVDTTGLGSNDAGAVNALWRDIVGGSGKIKLIGSAAFNRRTLSELAKLLDTPTGRRMLAFLNTPKDASEASDTTAARLTNIYLGDSPSQLPDDVKAASTSLEKVTKSKAQPLNIGGDRTEAKLVNVKIEDLVEDEQLDPRDYASVSTSADLHEVRDAAWSGAKGFVFGGRKFTFVGGTGAFVGTLAGRSFNAGRDDREVLTPGWVTLGHELGHAANFRAGASLVEEKVDPGNLPDRLTKGPERGYARWDNAEEMLNIENVENAIRGEAGLSERDSHQIPRFAIAKAAALKTKIRDAREELVENCATVAQGELLKASHPGHVAMTEVGKIPAKDLCVQAVYDRWEGVFARFLAMWTVGPPQSPRPSPALEQWLASNGPKPPPSKKDSKKKAKETVAVKKRT